jgi:hypothetical protein
VRTEYSDDKKSPVRSADTAAFASVHKVEDNQKPAISALDPAPPSIKDEPTVSPAITPLDEPAPRITDLKPEIPVSVSKQEGDVKPAPPTEPASARDKGKGKEIVSDAVTSAETDMVVDAKVDDHRPPQRTTSAWNSARPHTPLAMQPPKGPRHGISPSASANKQSIGRPMSPADVMQQTQSPSTSQPLKGVDSRERLPTAPRNYIPSPESPASGADRTWVLPSGIHPKYNVPWPVIPLPEKTKQGEGQDQSKGKSAGKQGAKTGNEQSRNQGDEQPNPETKEQREARHLDEYRRQRANLEAAYQDLYKDTRRLFRELELVSLDMRMTEQRRLVADAQLESAKAGTLGIENTEASVLPTMSD